MGAVGCRCLVDQRRSARVHSRICRRRRLSRQARLALATAFAIPALVLSLGGEAAPAKIAASTGSPVTMSSCAVDVAVCEVEMNSAVLSGQTSVRLTDGPVSIAPTRVIGVAMVVHRAADAQPEMLHAYFRLPRLSPRARQHWRLTVEFRHHARRSFALPTPRAAEGAL